MDDALATHCQTHTHWINHNATQSPSHRRLSPPPHFHIHHRLLVTLQTDWLTQSLVQLLLPLHTATMSRHLPRAMFVIFSLLLVVSRASAQLSSSPSSTASSAVVCSSSSGASVYSSTSAAALTEPSLSLPAWALAVLTIGGLLVFVVTLKLASCFYWLTEKQRADRSDEGLEEGRSGGVAPMVDMAPTTHTIHTAHGMTSTATVGRVDEVRKPAPTHISITQQGSTQGEREENSELSRWDSRASEEMLTDTTVAPEWETATDEGVPHTSEIVIVVSHERQ